MSYYKSSANVKFIYILFLFSRYLYYSECVEHGERNISGKEMELRSVRSYTGNIPPRPNYTCVLTAKPDPFETKDPTSQAKVILRNDLFSDSNGEILYYALLSKTPPLNLYSTVSLEIYSKEATNGTIQNISESWPDIPNWEYENETYQVTPVRWNPFKVEGTFSERNLTIVSYVLGDGSCSDDKYCNKPLKEKTRYAFKIRAFTHTGFQDTDNIYFETLDKLPMTKLLSILAGLLSITAVAVCLSIINLGWIKRLRIVYKGNVKKSFSPQPNALSQKSFLKYAQELLNTQGRLGNEFHLLGTLSSDVSTLCLHAQRVDNRNKNRYGNILPFDMTRVKLSVIDDDPSTDYINASFIKGYTQEIEYIACQGPKEETCHDFYRMILEQNVEMIVMLTELEEKGIEKCFKYYPDKGEVLKIKNITIFCKRVDDLEFCTRRVLKVFRNEKTLVVTQLHYRGWHDFSSPSSVDVMLKFCDLISRIPRRHCIVVHCSAGSGRTGTFIAIDILLQNVKNNNKINVFNTVLKLRQQRVSMVQTEAQLRYIYECVSRAIVDSLPKLKESSHI